VVEGTSDNLAKSDFLIRDGVIAEIAEQISYDFADKVIDCTGLLVMPGICDMHVHLRDPGQTHKEDLISGTNAAAAGGVTTVLCMPNTSPVLDTPELIRDIVERAKACKIKVLPCAAITKGIKGEELTDFAALKEAGAVAVSDDGMPVKSALLMSEAMTLANEANLTIISHCEDSDFGESRIGENLIIAREVCLAENMWLPVHIAHVSTKRAIRCIGQARKFGGVSVSCEITPHHFTLNQSDAVDSDYKMNPSLRKSGDVAALVNELSITTRPLTIAIASDHAPHSPEEKSGENPPNGVLGLETILAVTLTRLYHKHKVPLTRIVDLLCVNPRKILGIGGGKLEVGEPADIAIVDLEEEWVVDPDKLQSKSRNTCFKGMTLKGKCKYTLVDGEIVYGG
jgi:dihydroorotase